MKKLLYPLIASALITIVPFLLTFEKGQNIVRGLFGYEYFALLLLIVFVKSKLGHIYFANKKARLRRQDINTNIAYHPNFHNRLARFTKHSCNQRLEYRLVWIDTIRHLWTRHRYGLANKAIQI